MRFTIIDYVKAIKPLITSGNISGSCASNLSKKITRIGNKNVPFIIRYALGKKGDKHPELKLPFVAFTANDYIKASIPRITRGNISRAFALKLAKKSHTLSNKSMPRIFRSALSNKDIKHPQLHLRSIIRGRESFAKERISNEYVEKTLKETKENFSEYIQSELKKALDLLVAFENENAAASDEHRPKFAEIINEENNHLAKFARVNTVMREINSPESGMQTTKKEITDLHNGVYKVFKKQLATDMLKLHGAEESRIERLTDFKVNSYKKYYAELGGIEEAYKEKQNYFINKFSELYKEYMSLKSRKGKIDAAIGHCEQLGKVFTAAVAEIRKEMEVLAQMPDKLI